MHRAQVQPVGLLQGAWEQCRTWPSFSCGTSVSCSSRLLKPLTLSESRVVTKMPRCFWGAMSPGLADHGACSGCDLHSASAARVAVVCCRRGRVCCFCVTSTVARHEQHVIDPQWALHLSLPE